MVVEVAMGGLAEEVLIEIVADVLVAETTRRSSSVIILPVFMVVGDVKMAEVEVVKGLIVTCQGELPVVVEVVPGDGDPVGGAD